MTATTASAATMARIEPGCDQPCTIRTAAAVIAARALDCLNPAELASPLRTNNSAVRGEAFPAFTYT